MSSNVDKSLRQVWPTYLLASLVAVYLVIVFATWVGFAAGFPIRTILSIAGIRWFFLNNAQIFLSSAQVYLILFISVIGAFQRSGLDEFFVKYFRNGKMTYRQKVAFICMNIYVLVYMGVLIGLIIPPHAILLSATGSLMSSPFISGFIPAFTLCLHSASIIYGSISNRLRNMYECLSVLYWGIARYAIWIIIYFTVILTWETICYSFSDYISPLADKVTSI